MWNYRRLLLQSLSSSEHTTDDTHNDSSKGNAQQYIVDDLAFLLPLLRKFPKCYWIWNYRLWLLDEASRLLPSAATYQLWQKELGLVSKMLSLDSRNFHGWGYRRKVIAALEQLSIAANPSTTSMIETEFEYTTRMIETNLSNFSAWHRRSKLIPKLLEGRNATHAERCHFLDQGMLWGAKNLTKRLIRDQSSKLFSGHYGPILTPKTSHCGSIISISSPTLTPGRR